MTKFYPGMPLRPHLGPMTLEAARRRKLLVVHPGASYSTHDVARGLVRGLLALGHEVGSYALHHRIEIATRWVDYVRRRARKADPDTPAMSRDERLNRIFDEAAKDILAMALDNSVDGVLIISCMFVPAQALVRLRRAYVPVGLVLTESPYDDERHAVLAPLADVVWTNERTSVAHLRGVQAATHYLPAAYDPAVHLPGPQPGDEDVPAHDVVFVGTAFQERLDLLAAVDWSGIDLGLYGNFMPAVGGYPAGHRVRRLLARHVKDGPIDNQRAAALYRRARLGLNLHRTSIDFAGARHVAGAESINPRAYELAACGVFQVTDWRAELAEVLPACTAIVTPGTAEAVIRRALAEPAEVSACAALARRSVEPHTYTARAAQLVEQFAPALDRAGVVIGAWG